MKLSEQQLIKAIYSSWDFQQALSALTFLLEECNFDSKYDKISLRRFRCYESNLIISISRPLEKTRGGIVIGLKALGVKFTSREKLLFEKISDLRNKVIAHSQEDEMHFSTSTFPVDKLNIPDFRFSEQLFLSKQELLEIEEVLHKILLQMSKFFMKVAQENPELLRKHQEPKSINKNIN